MPCFVLLQVFSIQDPDERQKQINLYVLLFVLLGVLSFFSYFVQVRLYVISGVTSDTCRRENTSHNSFASLLESVNRQIKFAIGKSNSSTFGYKCGLYSTQYVVHLI